MKPLPLEILGYNPLNCSNQNRWTDILEETDGFDVVGLIGTGQGGKLDAQWQDMYFSGLAARYAHQQVLRHGSSIGQEVQGGKSV